MKKTDLTIQDVLRAYANGFFPMAGDREAPDFHWCDPPLRGQLPIETLHIPARLRRTILRFPCEIRIDTAFERVLEACAAPAPGRPRTWINAGIAGLFLDLHKAGYAHSVEVWREGALAGGLYGLALGGAFMGESMFSRTRDASKIALIHLCARLWEGGFSVLDTQYVNPHLAQFGVYEIPRAEYREKLEKALEVKGDFALPGTDEKTLVRDYLANRAAPLRRAVIFRHSGETDAPPDGGKE